MGPGVATLLPMGYAGHSRATCTGFQRVGIWGKSRCSQRAPAGAVFLSYASQDVEAARRICETLRAAGIEVWFDQSELRGGDAWDRKIRDHIDRCRLFLPVISATTERRDEGYFRR